MTHGPTSTLAAQGEALPVARNRLPSFMFVCTANRCRSPLAEALARRMLARHGRAAGVSSSGLLQDGMPTPDTGVAVAAEYGLDLTGHRSRRFRESLLPPDALILTMTRAQAREIVAAWPGLWPRVFTLKGFTDLASDASAPRRADFLDWIDAVGSGRQRSSLLGNGTPDEVRDPMGRPAAVWREVIEDLGRELDALLALASPLLPAAPVDDGTGPGAPG